MLVVARNKSEQNDAAIDPWTAVHFAIGLAFGLVEIPFVPAILAAGAYDLFEQAMERSQWGQDFFKTSGPETWANVTVDLVAFAGGHLLGTLWNRT